jgi:hypothetical protein
MKKLLLIGLVAGVLAFVPAQRSDAQVYFSVGFGGPGYGYYPYGYYYPYRYSYYRPYRYYGYRPYYWRGGHRYYRHHRPYYRYYR